MFALQFVLCAYTSSDPNLTQTTSTPFCVSPSFHTNKSTIVAERCELRALWVSTGLVDGDLTRPVSYITVLNEFSSVAVS